MTQYVPLSQRSADEIRAQAELYQQMAATARTPEAKRGLENLVLRLVALAERRLAAEPRFSAPVTRPGTVKRGGLSSCQPRPSPAVAEGRPARAG